MAAISILLISNQDGRILPGTGVSALPVSVGRWWQTKREGRRSLPLLRPNVLDMKKLPAPASPVKAIGAPDAPLRRALSAKVRFEVLKRDKFACQYCGAKAPDVLLEVDHVVPVAGGGGNDLANLVSSCKACNGGKGARLLSDDSVLVKQRAQLEELAERREQIELMMQWQNSLMNTEEDEAAHVGKYWGSIAVGWKINEHGVSNIRKLLRKYQSIDVMRAMRVSVDQYGRFENGVLTSDSYDRAFNYISRILAVEEAQKEDPFLKDYLYIRAVVRNNFKYCNQPLALEMIRKAHIAGVDIDDLKRLAKRSTCWMNWSRDMDRWTKEAEDES